MSSYLRASFSCLSVKNNSIRISNCILHTVGTFVYLSLFSSVYISLSLYQHIYQSACHTLKPHYHIILCLMILGIVSVGFSTPPPRVIGFEEWGGGGG